MTMKEAGDSHFHRIVYYFHVRICIAPYGGVLIPQPRETLTASPVRAAGPQPREKLTASLVSADGPQPAD
jgi:hypothetical protein